MDGLEPVPDLLAAYDCGRYFDELVRPDGFDSPGAATIRALLRRLPLEDLQQRSKDAERELFNLGITFLILSRHQSVDRILPFDLVPRLITPPEWERLERGVVQRLQAINLFLHDVYHGGRIFADGVVPRDLVFGNENYVPAMAGVDVPQDTYVHVMGTDLVRDAEGTFRVLEDNCRCPSGVSYVVENRYLMQRAFPDLMHGIGVRRVDNYGERLVRALRETAPLDGGDASVVLLSPGTYNSAYFEHVFLAREMGVPLVEGGDLVVEDDRVHMRTVAGLSPVHAIYRRIGDDFLDPEVFRKDSLLGVPGLMRAYLKGNVNLANAVGTGVADDKAVYAYMPRIVRYYLGEDAILPNVETHICREADGLAHTLDNLDRLVVKPVGEAGGYGILIGPRATREQIENRRRELRADPSNYVSQPVVPLSVCPTLTEEGLQPRHVDLRPFAVTGKSTWVAPGGLTRVALRQGTLVVNSSQGGGSKDTWVLRG